MRQPPKAVRYERHQLKFKKLYPQFEFGSFSYGVPLVKHWDGKTKLTIGSYCSIANNVQIFLGGNHRTDWITTYPFPLYFKEKRHIKDYTSSRGDVVIGSDVWICQNCTILSGVTIGHGAVIATGAVVTKNVEPYSVVAGVPAVHTKWRFDQSTRDALLATAWWDWPHSEVYAHIDQLCSGDVDAFLSHARQRQSINNNAKPVSLLNHE